MSVYTARAGAAGVDLILGADAGVDGCRDGSRADASVVAAGPLHPATARATAHTAAATTESAGLRGRSVRAGRAMNVTMFRRYLRCRGPFGGGDPFSGEGPARLLDLPTGAADRDVSE
jgi:hypothetical protein